MVKVLNKLFAHEVTRSIPEYPLAIRTPDNSESGSISESCYHLVYRNLCTIGYSIGCPNRLENPSQFCNFVTKLTTTVRDIYHTAGVIHGDLYASNIMWKADGHDNVDIKIIDWDGAHCVEEGDFSDLAKRALAKYFDKTDVQVAFDHGHDSRYVDVFRASWTEENSHHWAALASNCKVDMDKSFHALMMDMLCSDTDLQSNDVA